MAANLKVPSGPIPGENYTSDTRNYPWHRPPDITDLDSGVEASIKQLTTREGSYALLTMLQAGMSVVQATDIFVTTGIGAGKWSPDLGLLLAGPVSHMIKLMADGYGIKYDMGLADMPIPTISFLKEKAKIDPKKAVTVATDVSKMTEAFKANADAQQGAQQKGVGLLGAPDEGVNNMGKDQQQGAQPPSGSFMGNAGPPQQGSQEQGTPPQDESTPPPQPM
jgi:hypothetical protein